MTIYLIAFFLIFLFVFMFDQQAQQKRKNFLALWCLFIALVCGLGDMLGGYDRYIYGEIFDSTADGLAEGLPILQTAAMQFNPTEPGYGIWNVIIAFISSNRYIFLLLSTLVLYGMLYYHIIKYSKTPFLAFFILFCIFYFFTFTYLREVLAVGVSWFSIPYAIKRKPIHFGLIILLAFSFHNSALLFGLTYFIAPLKLTRQRIVIIVFLSLILGLTPLGSFVFELFASNINETKANNVLSNVENTNIFYIAEAIIFFIIILWRYKYIDEDETSRCMLNIALGFIFILMFFARFTDGGRMSWYFLIGVACTFAGMMSKKTKITLDMLPIILICSMFYFRILYSWGSVGILYPYKTFLTPGFAGEEWVYEQYEYDKEYFTNKFYRK